MATIVAIDFDGTIVVHKYPRIGAPAPGAFRWLKRFQELGARLILYTMRGDGRAGEPNLLSEAVEFCRANGVEFWAVNHNPEQHTWTASPKVYAHAYVDDAAVGTPMRVLGTESVVDWDHVGPTVEAFILGREIATRGD